MTAPTDAPPGPAFLARARALNLATATFPAPLGRAAELTVLDITKYFGETTGGIRTYLLSKAEYVQATPGLRMVLVVPGSEDRLGEADGVRAYQLRGPRIPFDQRYRFLLATRTTRRVLEHERPDVIEVGSPWLVPWLTRHANRGLRAPAVWFYHTHFPSIIAPPAGRTTAWRRTAGAAAWAYVRRLARLHQAVFVASDSVARELEREGVANVRRISLGVDLATFSPARRERREEVRARHKLPDAPLALYLGRFTEEKQLETVLAGWDEVARRTGAALVLVGTGPREPRLRVLAEGRAIHWVPFERNRERVADLLAASDLYVAPGPMETFGLSALEAMASGVPVLSVDSGGVADRVRASGCGAVYPIGDAGACAEQAVAVLGEDRDALACRARAWATTHHAAEVVFAGIFTAYRDVLTQARER